MSRWQPSCDAARMARWREIDRERGRLVLPERVDRLPSDDAMAERDPFAKAGTGASKWQRPILRSHGDGGLARGPKAL